MKINPALPTLICRAVALGLGLGVVVLTGMDKIAPDDANRLLGLGLTCLAASALGENSKHSSENDSPENEKNKIHFFP